MVPAHISNRPTRFSRALVLSFSKGFTLIELLVVTGIIVVISTIVLANNGRFGGVILLENLAYDVALSVRQAQVYGISVASFSTNQTNTFTAGYGVHFDTATPETYTLFADAKAGKPGTFNPDTDGSEIISTTVISGGYQIVALCAPEGADAASCTGVSQIDIAFNRPEPDAWISSGTPCSYGIGVCVESARIVLRSPRGDTMSVIVEANGQISVHK